jgi:uncharacterized protein involved in exopolysaccharide biosynthesis
MSTSYDSKGRPLPLPKWRVLKEAEQQQSDLMSKPIPLITIALFLLACAGLAVGALVAHLINP